ncbi:MAG: bifunctional (p)ppGpp synthetase/guanosine-3',5'-bis(diphosphate) 3'-pyrophosphohydrolase [Candidatus Pacebacteria bacterium]|nr:bifunctional (p)ppGpp synthetase/guanosine-3',5'-bis(diphosphate) 3'-pyrophosphohydrolase [Candidatus Paceibacterota bacterium]
MEGYEVAEILKALPTHHKPNDADLIIRAYDFALKAHQGQKRMSGEPYFIHVFETAKNLTRYETDAITIAAGFLHDVLEDTPTTDEQLEKEFGKEIVALVKGVTKLGQIKYKGHIRHVESLRKFIMALAQDYRVLLIKLADRLHNLRTLQYVRPEKQRRIALEAIEVYAPLADRFGIGKMKGEIEDAAFPFAYPKEYEMMEKILKERSQALEQTLANVYKELTNQIATSSVKIEKLDYRIKHKFSLWKKLQEHQMSIDHIYDIVALRVIVGSVEDCYAVLGIIHSLWKPLPSRIKDYIALPKPNGYQSLHTTIFTGDGGLVEVQIRTLAMHKRAEFGVASHYTYKEGPKKRDAREEKFKWTNEFKDLDNTIEEPDDFLAHLKTDLFSDRIFVFTPAGEVIDLPKGSSTIDFAYSIHSAIGNKASGAHINGKFCSLDTTLQSGDIVAIETRKDGAPKEKWLTFTKTTMAKKHIRTYLKEQNKKSLLHRMFPDRFK